MLVTGTPAGVTVTPFAPTEGEQVALGRDVMRACGDTFRQLAK